LVVRGIYTRFLRKNIKGFRVELTLPVNCQYSTLNSLDVNEDFFSLADLNAWEYSHSRFYWEYELWEIEDNKYILIWRNLHRNINQEGVSKVNFFISP
jgi:hypothetical protein